MIEPIKVTVVVNATPDVAFDAFVNDFGTWWPMAPFSMSEGTLTFDAGQGGQIVETAADGTRHVWGHVTVWQPGKTLAVLWYVGSTPDKATRVTVEFEQTDDRRTGVTLTQDGWEALGDQALSVRDRNDAGWQTILGAHFVPHANTMEGTTHHG